MDFETVIGLEVHAQLLTDTKIFTAAPAHSARRQQPRLPGLSGHAEQILPVLNKKVVEYAMRMALATHCAINPQNVFARKNYFYPDLPKGSYQISQYAYPLAEHGYIMIGFGEGSTKDRHHPDSHGGGRGQTDP